MPLTLLQCITLLSLISLGRLHSMILSRNFVTLPIVLALEMSLRLPFRDPVHSLTQEILRSRHLSHLERHFRGGKDGFCSVLHPPSLVHGTRSSLGVGGHHPL